MSRNGYSELARLFSDYGAEVARTNGYPRKRKRKHMTFSGFEGGLVLGILSTIFAVLLLRHFGIRWF